MATLLLRAVISSVALASPDPPLQVLNFSTDRGAACAARMGVLILSVDETIESEFAQYFAFRDGTALYHTRQYKGPAIDVHSLNSTKKNISAAASLLPQFAFDSIGFACTSDAVVLGASAIAGLVAATVQVQESAVTNPLTAAMRALHALSARRVAVLTPYTADISQMLLSVFERNGLQISAIAIFNQTADAVVARIDKRSVLDAVQRLAQSAERPDAIFVSCTQTRTVELLVEAERLTGLPVVSSNSAMAWDMLRLAGLLTADVQHSLALFGGRLFGTPVAGQGPRHQCQ